METIKRIEVADRSSGKVDLVRYGNQFFTPEEVETLKEDGNE